MSAYAKIYAALSASTALTALVSTRIYPVAIPQGVAAFPTLVYQRIGGHRIFALDGYTGVENPEFSIDCWAATYDGAKDVAKKVSAAMEAAGTFTAYLKNSIDSSDPETGVIRITQEYSVWNTES